MIVARLPRPPLAVLALAASLLLLILAGSAESTKIKGKKTGQDKFSTWSSAVPRLFFLPHSIKRGRDRPPVDRARVKSRVALCNRNQAAHSSGSSAPIKSTRASSNPPLDVPPRRLCHRGQQQHGSRFVLCLFPFGPFPLFLLPSHSFCSRVNPQGTFTVFDPSLLVTNPC